MAEVDTTPPVVEENPAEEQAPITEENKEATVETEPKKSVFSSFCGCFGGNSAVIEGEKPEVKELKDEAEDKPEETGKPEEIEDKPAETEVKPAETEVDA
eukprot:CAMPEP_0168178936 /NCGR_PEP_ID=MMETSP0139_2-20121125/9488_1 /TAXON_ID=44445 /ORGANISM="Pseudo-nitzschia australis, Strain 10249 10 AB" /LENGTH=99 /DNA_ID=CAMNT_0008098557 /DNA_START=198 /DNA_END=497 /DNA_ORIENTATION=-